jgi:quinol monooxygenase YgiN
MKKAGALLVILLLIVSSALISPAMSLGNVLQASASSQPVVSVKVDDSAMHSLQSNVVGTAAARFNVVVRLESPTPRTPIGFESQLHYNPDVFRYTGVNTSGFTLAINATAFANRIVVNGMGGASGTSIVIYSLEFELMSSAHFGDFDFTIVMPVLGDESFAEIERDVPQKLTVTVAAPIVNAANPNITTHPQSHTFLVGTQTDVELSVGANSSDGGTISYQWFRNTGSTATYTGGTPIIGETDTEFTASTSEIGVAYYWAEVTNTNNDVNGTKTSMVRTNIATIRVNALTHAQTPNITVQPQNRVVAQGAVAQLSVTATRTDGGVLGYQWFSNSSNSTIGGTPVGTNSATFNAPTGTLGQIWYYVVVTNTFSSATGDPQRSVTSDVVSVTVNQLVNAAAPISTQITPANQTVNHNSAVTALEVTASSPDGGTISYQWFRNTSNSNTGGTAVGANSPFFAPSSSVVGTLWYYVIVTNTNPSLNGTQTAIFTSNTVSVETVALVNAAQPVIQTGPQGKTVSVGENATLSVTASSPDDGVLSYQWYRNTINSTSGGTPVGVNSSVFNVPTGTPGILFYYVVVTNTKDGVSGSATATRTSTVVAITVQQLSNPPQQDGIELTVHGAISVTRSDSLANTWHVIVPFALSSFSVAQVGGFGQGVSIELVGGNNRALGVGANEVTLMANSNGTGTEYYLVITRLTFAGEGIFAPPSDQPPPSTQPNIYNDSTLLTIIMITAGVLLLLLFVSHTNNKHGGWKLPLRHDTGRKVALAEASEKLAKAKAEYSKAKSAPNDQIQYTKAMEALADAGKSIEKVKQVSKKNKRGKGK